MPNNFSDIVKNIIIFFITFFQVSSQVTIISFFVAPFFFWIIFLQEGLNPELSLALIHLLIYIQEFFGWKDLLKYYLFFSFILSLIIELISLLFKKKIEFKLGLKLKIVFSFFAVNYLFFAIMFYRMGENALGVLFYLFFVSVVYSSAVISFSHAIGVFKKQIMKIKLL